MAQKAGGDSLSVSESTKKLLMVGAGILALGSIAVWSLKKTES